MKDSWSMRVLIELCRIEINNIYNDEEREKLF